jgi:hypothetical protein
MDRGGAYGQSPRLDAPRRVRCVLQLHGPPGRSLQRGFPTVPERPGRSSLTLGEDLLPARLYSAGRNADPLSKANRGREED